MNTVLAVPTRTSSTSSVASVGATAAPTIAEHGGCGGQRLDSGDLEGCHEQPAGHGACPHGGGEKAERLRVPVQRLVCEQRQDYGKLVREGADQGHHQQWDKQSPGGSDVVEPGSELPRISASATSTARKLAVLARKQIPTPTSAINPPATAGPTAREAFVSTLLRLTAF
jgi:hypothetical protein